MTGINYFSPNGQELKTQRGSHSFSPRRLLNTHPACNTHFYHVSQTTDGVSTWEHQEMNATVQTYCKCICVVAFFPLPSDDGHLATRATLGRDNTIWVKRQQTKKSNNQIITNLNIMKCDDCISHNTLLIRGLRVGFNVMEGNNVKTHPSVTAFWINMCEQSRRGEYYICSVQNNQEVATNTRFFY